MLVSLALLAAACGTDGGGFSGPGGDGDGDSAVDGGGATAREDGGGAVTRDAECNIVRTERQDRDADDVFTENRNLYAATEVDSDTRRVWAKLCSYEERPDATIASGGTYCPPGYTCTDDDDRPATSCEIVAGAPVGSEAVIWCGIEIDARYAAGGAVTRVGGRWTSVEFTIE